MSEDFATHIQNARERLNKRRDELSQYIAGWQRELAELDREFAAIEAYEAAKTGKPATANTAGTPRRARKGSRREDILTVIRAAPAGMSRGDIIQHLGLKGDKSGEMSVSNALTALTKGNQLVREGGKYHAPADVLRQAAE